MSAPATRPLSILHVFRSPVGGLFRHVADLAEGQIARGHKVGMILTNLTGGQRAEDVLRDLAPRLALGITRIPMHRQLHPGDFAGARHVTKRIADTGADVIHGHGAKGGAFARLSSAHKRIVRAYTPHSGSLLFSRATLAGFVYLTLERILMPRGNLYLFESGFSEKIFRSKVGNPRGVVRVVHNGVAKQDFNPEPIVANPTDLIFLGELRREKGIDVLLDALGQLKQAGRNITLTLVGDGASGDALRAQCSRLGLDATVEFTGAMPGRVALSRGRIMLVPSRAESLPYVVLEAAAAGKPLISTTVGGIPEIFGPFADRLVPPNDVSALARAIAKAMDDPDDASRTAQALRERVAQGFSVDTMADSVLAGYRDALACPRD